MPMYSFACEGCGKRFDELVSYSQRDQVRCPDCQAETRVLIAAFAVQGSSSAKVAPAVPVRSPFS